MTSRIPLGVVTRALSVEDIRLFFEAIGEYGKDFQKIEQYMAQKSQDRNQSRNRDQIRNFHRKLYGKLTQLVKIDERIDKVVQELYLLINYGEIWKRFNKFRFDRGTKKMLDELVNHGHTTLRFKNKNIRIRTPFCKALKKVNEIGIDEKEKVITSREMPKDISVEFHPASTRDWLVVQSLSQNPRLKAKLLMQKRISNILDYLEQKWNIESLSNHNSQNDDNSDHNEATPTIRLKPSPNHELNEVNIARIVPNNHIDLSLSAYTKKMADRLITNGLNMSNKVNSSSEAASLTTPDASILLENSCTSDKPTIDQARKHLNILQKFAGCIEGCENSRTFDDTQDRSLSSMPFVSNIIPQHQAISEHNVASIQEHETTIVRDSIYSEKESTNQEFNIPTLPRDQKLVDWLTRSESGNLDSNNPDILNNDAQSSVANTNNTINHMIEVKKLAEGWTTADKTSLTVGELYLAFKCPNKIVLEYQFENYSKIHKSSNHFENILLFRLLTVASISLAENDVSKQLPLTNTKKKTRRQASTMEDIEANNQRVEEALKQLQPTRLTLHRRTR